MLSLTSSSRTKSLEAGLALCTQEVEDSILGPGHGLIPYSVIIYVCVSVHICILPYYSTLYVHKLFVARQLRKEPISIYFAYGPAV